MKGDGVANEITHTRLINFKKKNKRLWTSASRISTKLVVLAEAAAAAEAAMY